MEDDFLGWQSYHTVEQLQKRINREALNPESSENKYDLFAPSKGWKSRQMSVCLYGRVYCYECMHGAMSECQRAHNKIAITT